jgi:hypothetical protein
MRTLDKLNPVQLHLLEMFAWTEGEEELAELKEVLVKYYREKVDREMDRLTAEGVISPESIEAQRYLHERTPYL